MTMMPLVATALSPRLLIAQSLPALGDATSFLGQLTPGRVLAALVTFGLAWLAARGLSRMIDFLGARVARTRFFFKRLEPVLRIAVWFVALFILLDLLAPSQETFVAVIGSLAIALGLGAQDLVRNVIGGLTILTDHPYQLGDRVRIGDAYGEIDHIGLRSTRLTTPDDTRVTIPNATVVSSHVFNANSGVPDCQVVTDLFLPLDTDPDLAIRIGREAAVTSRYVLARKPVVVLLSDELREHPYLRLRIKAYVYDHRYESRMQSDVTTTVKRELRRLGFWAGTPATPPAADPSATEAVDPRDHGGGPQPQG